MTIDTTKIMGEPIHFWGIFLTLPGEQERLVRISLSEDVAKEKLKVWILPEMGYPSSYYTIRKIDTRDPEFFSYQQEQIAKERDF